VIFADISVNAAAARPAAAACSSSPRPIFFASSAAASPDARNEPVIFLEASSATIPALVRAASRSLVFPRMGITNGRAI